MVLIENRLYEEKKTFSSDRGLTLKRQSSTLRPVSARTIIQLNPKRQSSNCHFRI